jgi:hypothetical protein
MNTDEHGCHDSGNTDPSNDAAPRYDENDRALSSRYPCSSVFICGFLLLCCLLRGGVLLLLSDGLQKDADGYWRLAENLVRHGTLGQGDVPTAYRPPLYPLLLTPCTLLGSYGRTAVGVLHVVLGVATVGMVLALARRWGLGRRGAALAALLVACDPILLAGSAQVMTETLATFLTTAGLLVLAIAGSQRLPEESRKLAHIPGAVGSRLWLPQMAAGIVLALAALCRPAFLLWTLAAGAILWWQKRQQKTFVHVLSFPWAFCLGALLVLSPWAIRNQVQFGRPIVTTTHGGYTLLLANNPAFYDWLRTGAWGTLWQADQFNADWNARRPADELQADRQAYTEALQTIRRQPATFLHACLVRVGRFWSPLPHQLTLDETPARRLSRYAVAIWYIAEYALVLLGIWRLGWRRGEWRVESGEERIQAESGKAEGGKGSRITTEMNTSSFLLSPSPLRLPSSTWFWGLVLILILLAGHLVYWTDMRMRAPIMPVVALIAAGGLFVRKQTTGFTAEKG